MRFKPKRNEIYYTITILEGEFKAVFFEWTCDDMDRGRYKVHNCFRTKGEVDKAIDKILKVLNKK